MNSADDNKYIFETVDPLNNLIYLDEDRYLTHIVTEHPQMTGKEQLIQTNIEKPLFIMVDKNFDDVYNYYTIHSDSSLSTYGPILKVCVEMSNFGRVSTAFLVNVIGKDIKQIYP